MRFRTDGKTKVFTDRLATGRETLALRKGRHTLRFMLDPAVPGGRVHAVGKVWLSNDPPFRPEGFNPRADFRKGRFDK